MIKRDRCQRVLVNIFRQMSIQLWSATISAPILLSMSANHKWLNFKQQLHLITLSSRMTWGNKWILVSLTISQTRINHIFRTLILINLILIFFGPCSRGYLREIFQHPIHQSQKLQTSSRTKIWLGSKKIWDSIFSNLAFKFNQVQ